MIEASLDEAPIDVLLFALHYGHRFTLWMTPRLAVAVNFAQFVALASHSRFSLQKQTKPLVKQSLLVNFSV